MWSLTLACLSYSCTCTCLGVSKRVQVQCVYCAVRADGWLMVSGAGEMRNVEEVYRGMKRAPNLVTIGLLPWGALSDGEARRLVRMRLSHLHLYLLRHVRHLCTSLAAFGGYYATDRETALCR